jgi:hypothetical protein
MHMEKMKDERILISKPPGKKSLGRLSIDERV